MKWLLVLIAAALAGGALYASGVFARGTVYDKPFARAYADLSTMSVSAFVDDKDRVITSALEPLHADVTRAPRSIGWDVRYGPTKIGKVIAQLTPVGSTRTRVVIDVIPVADGDPEASKSPSIGSDFARVAVTELIDARLENRQPTAKAIGVRMAMRMSTQPGQLRDFGAVVEQSVGQTAGVMRKTNELAAERRPVTTADATRPSVAFK